MAGTDKFVETMLTPAVDIQRKFGLPAVIMVAQAILETGYGKHIIKNPKTGVSSYNLFNIKGEGSAGKILVSTLEFEGDRLVKVDSYFRAYHSYAESFADYATFILRNGRYEPAVAVAKYPEKYAVQLQEAGYATDPNYAKKLLDIVSKEKLVEKIDQEIKEQEAQDLIASETPSDWAKASVEKANRNGIMVGYGEGIWQPHAVVTREMLAVILDRLGLVD